MTSLHPTAVGEGPHWGPPLYDFFPSGTIQDYLWGKKSNMLIEQFKTIQIKTISGTFSAIFEGNDVEIYACDVGSCSGSRMGYWV